jgi:hypothetical protein
VVSVNHVIVVAAQVSATVGAELRRWLAATLLMLLKLLGAAESSDVANLHLLAGFERGVEREVWIGLRLG